MNYEQHTLLVLICLALILAILAYRKKRIYEQNYGEALVSNKIRNCIESPYHLFNNVTLKKGKETTQIDHILITSKGIFVIETKHYSGWIFGTPDSRYWQQSIYHFKSRFPNPISQNQRQIRFLSELFKLEPKYYNNVVVFSGNSEFRTELGKSVIELSDLKNLVEEKEENIISEKMMTYIVGKIEMCRMPRSLETDEYHMNFLESKFKEGASRDGQRSYRPAPTLYVRQEK